MANTTTKGKIILKDGTPAVNYKVEIIDWDVLKDDLLGTKYTNSDGEYSLTHSNKQDPGRRRKGRFADIYIKVYTPNSDQDSYRSEVHWNYSASELTINATVDSFKTTTKGQIHFDDGTPAELFKVIVWDKDIGQDDFLGETFTDSNGNYSVTHRTKQDWGRSINSRLADIYIQVIEKNGSLPIYTSSPPHDNYSRPMLTINATINKILVTYGANTIYGQVVFEKKSGNISPFGGLKVYAYDDDIFKDDKLGDAITDNDGNFVISGFNEDDYKNIFEGKPDIFLKIYQGDTRIWKTKYYRGSDLPLDIGIIKIPEIIVKGYIKSYKYDDEVKPVTSLSVQAWDYDAYRGVVASNRRSFDDFIAETNVIYIDKVSLYLFEMKFYGTRDRHSGSDIYVVFHDIELEKDIEDTSITWHVDIPKTIWINSHKNPREIEYKTFQLQEQDLEPCEGDGGTIVHVNNLSGETRYIYKNRIHIFTMAADSDEIKDIFVEPGTLVSLEAFSELYDGSNWGSACTSGTDVIGGCNDTPIHGDWVIIG